MPADTSEFPPCYHTVDAVIFGLTPDEWVLKVLLILRGREGSPFFNHWALPGGFLDPGETLNAGVRRELWEETHFEPAYLEQLGTFGDPGRDPRGWIVSTAYMALTQPSLVEGCDDAKDARWWPVDQLPPLAFDHDKILKVGLQRLKSKLRWQPVGFEMLPEKFTITCLRKVYETILGHNLDKANFRKRVLRYGLLHDTGETIPARPQSATLYRFDRAHWLKQVAEGLDFEV